MHPFIHKYRPKATKEIVGQDEAVKSLRNFIVNFSHQKKKSALIYGQSGTGKTSSVYAIAGELGYEVIEVNASDFRNADQIEQKVGNAIKQQSLFSSGKIILVDEIEGLSGNKDRGGLLSIIKLIQTSTFPIVLTANDPFDNKYSSLRSKTNLIEFKSLDYSAIASIISRICEKEGIIHTEDLLKSLARRAGGDSRAAINDLQSLTSDTKSISKEKIQELEDRNRTEGIESALNKIFKTTDINLANSAFYDVNEDLNEQLLWLDENLPKEYTKPEDLARAYDMLSKADVFNRRIRRWQHYRFLVYISSFITAGIAVAKDEKYKHTIEYKQTGRLLKIWWANQKSFKKKSIAEKIGRITHTSPKQIIKNTIPYIPILFKDKQMRQEIINELELNDEEIEWVNKQVV